MNCEYCGRGDCPAIEDCFMIRKCREVSRIQTLRAEAEVRAACGDPTALDPYLPDGWEWRQTHWYRFVDDGRGWGMLVETSGAWNIHRYPAHEKGNRAKGKRRGILAAMAAADRSLAEASDA